MGECAAMAGVGMPVIIDGRTWHLSPVTLEDLGLLERWVEAHPIRMVQSALDGLDDRHRQYLLALAFGESIKRQVTLGTASGEGLLGSIEATAFLFWLSIRVKHPEITRDQAGRMLRTDNVELVKAALDKASGLRDAAKAKPAEGPETGRGATPETMQQTPTNAENSIGQPRTVS